MGLHYNGSVRVQSVLFIVAELGAAPISNRWRVRRLRNPLDRQETDVTSIRFAAASGALGMAR